MQLEIYKAQVIYNGLGTAQANAGILIQDNGREVPQIMNVTSLQALLEIAESVEMEFPIQDKGFAISPAPVNAHIDLTGHTLTEAELVIEQLKTAGITVVGMVANDAELMSWLLHQSLEGVIYWQVHAPNPNDADAKFNSTVNSLREFKALESEKLKVGLAFESIYSVSESLLGKLAQLCKQNKVPLQISVAQSQAEYDLYTAGSGRFVEGVLELHPAWQAPMLSPVQYLKKIGVLEAEPSLVHMTYVDEDDIRTVQHAGCTVIHCPRVSEDNHTRFPWESYMKIGTEVAFGTGSIDFNSDLEAEKWDIDIRKDVQAALRLHQEKISPLAAVRSAVKGGYRALKMKPPIINKTDPASKLYIW